MNNLINVQLIGDYMLGRKLIAEYLYCGNAHECSAYADGRCFMVKTWLREKCKYGSIKIIEGGGDNQKVMLDAVESPCYGKLKYPIDTYISKIGGDAYFTLKYVSMRIEPTGRLVCNENSPFTTATLASEDMLTPECIMQICSAHPGGIDGELVTMYQSKIVPHSCCSSRSSFRTNTMDSWRHTLSLRTGSLTGGGTSPSSAPATGA